MDKYKHEQQRTYLINKIRTQYENARHQLEQKEQTLIANLNKSFNQQYQQSTISTIPTIRIMPEYSHSTQMVHHHHHQQQQMKMPPLESSPDHDV